MRLLSVASLQNMLGTAWHNVLLTSTTLLVKMCVKYTEQVGRGRCNVFVPCARYGTAKSALSWLMKRELSQDVKQARQTRDVQGDMTRSSMIFICFTVLPGNTTANILAE
jgi:hypothetical protein